jgi:hypothetical protein
MRALVKASTVGFRWPWPATRRLLALADINAGSRAPHARAGATSRVRAGSRHCPLLNSPYFWLSRGTANLIGRIDQLIKNMIKKSDCTADSQEQGPLYSKQNDTFVSA